MPAVSELTTKPVGEILREVGLINDGQIQVALMEQNIYNHLKFGEILALHGWIKQETADFFAEKMPCLIQEKNHIKIGSYFHQAGLLSQQDIEAILMEQQKLGIKFGSVAVLKGCIKQETLEFFLKYFVPEKADKTDFTYKDKDTLTQKKTLLEAQLEQDIDSSKTLVEDNTLIQEDDKSVDQNKVTQEDLEDIPWID